MHNLGILSEQILQEAAMSVEEINVTQSLHTAVIILIIN